MVQRHKAQKTEVKIMPNSKIAQRIIRQTKELEGVITQGSYNPTVDELAHDYDLISIDAATDVQVQAISHENDDIWQEGIIRAYSMFCSSR